MATRLKVIPPVKQEPFTPLARIVGFGVVIGTLKRCRRGDASLEQIDKAIDIANALGHEAVASMDESDG